MLFALIALIAFVDLGAAFTVDDCPAALPRDQHLKVFGDSCYQFVIYRTRGFKAAQEECNANKGTLPLVKTQEINDFLKNTLKSLQYRGDYLWIGLTDQKKEEEFVWLDGTALNYTNWVNGVQPHDVFQYRWNDCVAINPIDGTWEDEHCESSLSGLIDNSRPYICQFSLTGAI